MALQGLYSRGAYDSAGTVGLYARGVFNGSVAPSGTGDGIGRTLSIGLRIGLTIALLVLG